MVKAVILAAGQGKRIAESLNGKPKPLLHIFGKALIEYPLSALEKNSIEECIIVTGYMADSIKNYFEDRRNYRIKIRFIHNPNYECENGYSLYSAKKFLENDEWFLVLMADHLIDSKIVRKALEEIENAPLLCTDASPKYFSQLKDATRVLVNRDGFIENIGKNIAEWNALDTGVFILNGEIFRVIEGIKDKCSLTLARCVKSMIQSGVPLWSCDVSGFFWLDVDVPKDIDLADKILREIQIE